MSKSVNPVSFVGTADVDKSVEEFKDFTIRSDGDAPKVSSAPVSANESPGEPSQSSSPEKNTDREDSTGGEKSQSNPPTSPPVPSIMNASVAKD